jgi:histidyl-tRNA synthetase
MSHDRMPPNQSRTAPGRWPVIGERTPAAADPDRPWTLTVDGLIAAPRTFSLDELAALPPSLDRELDAYLLCLDDARGGEGLALASELRRAVPGLRLQWHCGGGKPKSRLKKADASGAELALILGEQEFEDGTVTVKLLREEGGQRSLPRAELIEELKERVAQQATR